MGKFVVKCSSIFDMVGKSMPMKIPPAFSELAAPIAILKRAGQLYRNVFVQVKSYLEHKNLLLIRSTSYVLNYLY